MKQSILAKMLAGVSCTALLSTLLLCGCTTGTTTKKTSATTAGKDAGSASTPLASTGDTLQKDETVYVLCGADGTVSKVIVSDWLKNGTKDATISDSTSLSDLKVVKGDTSYSLNDKNMKVWDAKGGDVYYQGTSKESLPVDVKVSYKLNGTNIAADKLAGQSGSVTIRYDYTNTMIQTATIGGKEASIYVPFAMMTGLMLDNDVFSNVKVSNGKIVNTTDNTIVLGFALPGMQENLNIDKDTLDIPNYVEITADVKKFSLGNTMTLATNELFSDVDTSKLTGKADELRGKLTTLTNGMTQLINGSSRLYAGLDTLLSKSKQLIDGIDTLAGYSSQLNTYAQKIDSTVKDQLVSGNGQLTGGAKTTYQSLLKTAQSSLESQTGVSLAVLTGGAYTALTLDAAKTKGYEYQYEEVLATIKAKAPYTAIAEGALRKQLTTAGVTDATTQNAAILMIAERLNKGTAFDAAVTEVSALLKDAAEVSALSHVALTGDTQSAFMMILAANQITDPSVLTPAQTAAFVTLARLCAHTAFLSGTDIVTFMSKAENVAACQEKAQNAGTVLTYLTTASATDEKSVATVNATVAALCGSIADKQVKPQLTAGIDTALAQLSGTKAAPGFKYLYQGISAYTNGVSTLSTNLSAYSAKMKEFDAGMASLKQQSSALTPGIAQLKDGAQQLTSGLQQLNKDGIQKIADLVNGDLTTLCERLKAVVNASKSYKSYSGIADGMDGSAKFIYKTDSIV